MMDEETGTLWSHVTGEAMDGELAGNYLEDLPVVQTTWSWWKEKFPETLVLKKDAEIKSSRYERYFKDPDRAGMFTVEWLKERMPAKTKVHGIVRGPHALAITDEKLLPDALFEADVGPDPIVIVRAGDGGVRAFVAMAGEKRLAFAATYEKTLIPGQSSDDVDADFIGFIDKETSSKWDMDRGLCIAGELEGTQLEEVVTLLAFWFAWSNFYPKTEIID